MLLVRASGGQNATFHMVWGEGLVHASTPSSQAVWARPLSAGACRVQGTPTPSTTGQTGCLRCPSPRLGGGKVWPGYALSAPAPFPPPSRTPKIPHPTPSNLSLSFPASGHQTPRHDPQGVVVGRVPTLAAPFSQAGCRKSLHLARPRPGDEESFFLVVSPRVESGEHLPICGLPRGATPTRAFSFPLRPFPSPQRLLVTLWALSLVCAGGRVAGPFHSEHLAGGAGSATKESTSNATPTMCGVHVPLI